MMAHLLVEIRANREEMRAGQELLKEVTARLAKMNAKLDAYHERMIAKLDAWIEGMVAHVGKSEANPEKSDVIAEHQEVPKEEAAYRGITHHDTPALHVGHARQGQGKDKTVQGTSKRGTFGRRHQVNLTPCCCFVRT
jgi:hypothetical protein